MQDDKIQDIEKLYSKVMNFADDLLFENEPLAIAAVFNTISLSMWKTMLTEGDYSDMIQAIVDNSDNVKKLSAEGGSLH